MDKEERRHTGQRIKYISLLQTLAIILVVVGHSVHEYPTAHGTGTLLYRMVYSFHMPLFVFISGILFALPLARGRGLRPYREFVRAKVWRLLVPYLVLGAGVFYLRCSMSSMADEPIEASWTNLALSLVYSDRLVIVFFWFLTMLFLTLNIFYWAVRMAGSRTGAVFFMIAAPVALALHLAVPTYAVQLFSVSRVCELAVYFVAGMAYCRWQGDVDKCLHTDKWLTVAVAAALWVVAFNFTGNFAGGDLICALCGICMTLALAKNLERCGVTFLDHLEGFSYMIFLLSWFTGVLSQQVLHHFTDFDWWVYSIVAVMTSIYIPVAVGKYLQRQAPRRKWARAALKLLGH